MIRAVVDTNVLTRSFPDPDRGINFLERVMRNIRPKHQRSLRKSI